MGNWKIFMLAAVAALAMSAPVSAQRAPRGPGGPGGPDGPGRLGAALGPQGGGGVERILQLRAELELSEVQIAELNAIRAEQLARRQEANANMMRLRSDLAAGETTLSDMRAALQESRTAAEVEPGQTRERIEAILTEEQRESLRQRVAQARRAGARMRGRPGNTGPRGFAPRARRGRGIRPGAGFGRGGPAPFGQEFGPVRGFRGRRR